MQKAWYILNYHDIAWEENALLRPIGGTFSPDLFEDHIIALKSRFQIVDIQTGFNAWKNNTINSPLISIWFDDGFAGCRKYAQPILSHYGYSAAISINSAFTLQQEIYWRLQLAWLSTNGLLPGLKKELKSAGYIIPTGIKLREYTLGEFDLNMRQIINAYFNSYANTQVIKSAHALFDSIEGLNTLKSSGWTMANHSASHFPVSEKKSLPFFLPQFLECDTEMKKMFGEESPFWVLPFDRKPDPGLHAMFEAMPETASKTLVHVGNKINTQGAQSRYLYRLFVPDVKGKDLLKYLQRF